MSDKIIKITFRGYQCTLETIDPITLRYCKNDYLHSNGFDIGPDDCSTDSLLKKTLNHLRDTPKDDWNKFALLNIGGKNNISKDICKAVLGEKLIVVKY